MKQQRLVSKLPAGRPVDAAAAGALQKAELPAWWALRHQMEPVRLAQLKLEAGAAAIEARPSNKSELGIRKKRNNVDEWKRNGTYDYAGARWRCAPHSMRVEARLRGR